MLKVGRAGSRRRLEPSLSHCENSVQEEQGVEQNNLLEVTRKKLQDQDDLIQTADELYMRPTLPQLNPEEESSDGGDRLERLLKITQPLQLSDEQLHQIEQRMVMEINWGLGRFTNPSSNIKSYITYVTHLPSGQEHGSYLALDLGGTNFRVLLVEVEKESSSVRIKASKHLVSEALMTGPGENLFDFMAAQLHEFMVEHGLVQGSPGQPPHTFHLGFTFSFPTQQHSINSADLATWTKGYVCEGVVGVDVVKLLEKSIAKYKDISIKVCAILNDTTGCLIACAYKRHDCAVGVIIGTGTNASYMEEIDNVELFEGHKARDVSHVAINTEWGALGNTGSLDFIRTKFDLLVDQESKNTGKQVYEKLISGMYLGEITRQILCEAAKQGIIFREQEWAKVLEKKDAFLTKHISEIESDAEGEYEGVWEVLGELKLRDKATLLDCKFIRYICACVSTRAAVLAAAGVAALLNKMKRTNTTVGMDGSLYKFHPTFSVIMASKVRQLVHPSYHFQLVLSEDGSGRGAGLAAAALSMKA